MCLNTRAIPGGRRATSRAFCGRAGWSSCRPPGRQAFHATPDDLWRFSVRGLMRLFGRLEIVSAFYSGGDVGLDVRLPRRARDGKPELDPRSGAVEQGLFQLVAATTRTTGPCWRARPLSACRCRAPTCRRLFVVNIVGPASGLRLSALEPSRHRKSGLCARSSRSVCLGLRLEAQVHAEQDDPAVAADEHSSGPRCCVHHGAAGQP